MILILFAVAFAQEPQIDSAEPPEGPILDHIRERRNDPDREEKRQERKQRRWGFFKKLGTGIRWIIYLAVAAAVFGALGYVKGWLPKGS